MRTELIDYDPDPQREDEITREQRWAEFVTLMREHGTKPHHGYPCIVRIVGDLMRGHSPDVLAPQIMDFARDEGWDGVLSAMARALREDEQARRELMDRR